MYCRYCGKEIDADSTFCRYCGKEQGVAKKKDSKLDMLSWFSSISLTTRILAFLWVLWLSVVYTGMLFDRRPKSDEVLTLGFLVPLLVVVAISMGMSMWTRRKNRKK